MRHVRVSTPVASTPSVTDLTPIPTIQMEQQGLALQVCSYEPRDHRPAGSAYPVALAGRSFVFINDLPYFFLSRKLESIGKVPDFLYNVIVKLPSQPRCPAAAPTI